MAYVPELIIVPAYCRSYNSKKAIWQDWTDGKDFQIASYGPFMGRYINKEDAESSHLACLIVRYGKELAKSATIDLIKNKIL